MYASPLKRQRKVTVGIVLPSLQIVTEWGEERALEKLAKHKLYAYNMTALNEYVKQGKARMKYWHGYPILCEIGDVKVANLPRATVQNKQPEEALAALQQWAHWIQANGGNVGSVSGSSMSVWRAIIERDYYLNVRRGGTLPQKVDWFVGPRIESEMGQYSNVSAWDIRSAYPYACSQLALPARYEDISNHSINENGYARAIVRVPEMDYGPLPLRLSNAGQVIYPTKCTIEGVWELAELRMAKEYGCDVTIEHVWKGKVYTKTWEAWLAAMLTGRELPGAAARLAKITANALWGTFIVEGSARWVYYEDGIRFQFYDLRKLTPIAVGIAGHVVASVRRRLYQEALTSGKIVAAHTDGLIARDGWQPERTGDNVGQWARKWSSDNADVKAMGMYRYQNAGEWTYSTGDQITWERAWNDALRAQRMGGVSSDLQAFRQGVESGEVVRSAPNDYMQRHGIEM